MQQAVLTVDLGFGDAGKGSIVDFLTRSYAAHTVVRYNGGAQAGHRVVTAESTPREHAFAQFGSGTLAGAATHLSRFMLLDPLAMLQEERHLAAIGVPDAFERTTIDAGALVITPFARAVNRLRELARGDGRHGSCGMGIGETAADHLAHGERVLFAGDLREPDTLRAKLCFLRAISLAKARALRPAPPDGKQAAKEWDLLLDAGTVGWLASAYAEFADQARIVPGDHLEEILRRPGAVVFEGAQGVLLDEWRGFHPYTTWSTTTLANADRLLAEAHYTGEVTRIGITRAYTTRHGAGPLVTEDAELTHALPDARNVFGAWQGSFRAGSLDLVMLGYALAATGPLDALAITCVDRLAGLPELRVCRRYHHGDELVERLRLGPLESLEYQEQLTQLLAHCRPAFDTVRDPQALLDLLEAELGVPIGIVSRGPTAADKTIQPALRV